VLVEAGDVACGIAEPGSDLAGIADGLYDLASCGCS
jgi:hypothetical protein